MAGPAPANLPYLEMNSFIPLLLRHSCIVYARFPELFLLETCSSSSCGSISSTTLQTGAKQLLHAVLCTKGRQVPFPQLLPVRPGQQGVPLCFELEEGTGDLQTYTGLPKPRRATIG